MKLISKIKILIIIMSFACMIPFYSYASEINLISETTEEFDKWNKLSEEEKEKTQLPEMFSIEIPENIYSLEENDDTNILEIFKKVKNRLGSKKSDLEEYNLLEDIDVYVKNQGITGQCWAFSILSSMETNLALTKGKYKDFSERHIAYSTARNFIDGENKNGFNRKVNEYGLQTMALAYLTNGQGAVLEEKMPFENNENEIYLSQINIEKDTYVTDYEIIPSIYKTYDSNGDLIYSNGNGIIYTKKEVNNIRNQIKEHIVKYGAISAVTAANQTKYYNNEEDITKSTSYYCNSENVLRDHAVTIIGWDDNYSRENFNKNIKPNSDGAYIALNSYGEDIFESGYIYISYEDILIETSLYGISGTSDEEYYKIYQHDYFGGIANLGTKNNDTGYYANIYSRNTNEYESLNHIGISICDYVKLNVYVNPNGEDLSKENLTKVASTEILTPGYHTIDISNINLTSEKFAIVVEQISENDKFMFVLETYIENTVYNVVTAESGNSKVSFDGNSWYNLSDMGTISGIDTSKSDTCIKAFTTKIDKPIEPEEPSNEITSTTYEIVNGYIKNIECNTTLKTLKERITATETIKILDNDVEIFEEDILKTGMTLKAGDKEYKIVVTGDINGDGKISILDISKIVLHYNEQKGFILSGANKEAGDINQDNKISLIDISKLIILFNNIP